MRSVRYKKSPLQFSAWVVLQRSHSSPWAVTPGRQSWVSRHLALDSASAMGLGHWNRALLWNGMAAYLCPLSMFSNGICGVSRFYLMSLPLCVKPGTTCVTPSSIRVALMLPMAFIWLGPGTMPSALYWPNTGLPYLLIGTQSSQLPAHGEFKKTQLCHSLLLEGRDQ